MSLEFTQIYLSSIEPAYAKAPLLENKKWRPLKLDAVLPIIESGRGCITESGIDASLDGDYQRQFGRDTYYTHLGLLNSIDDFDASLFPDNKTLLRESAKTFLQYMNDEGRLPHEVGDNNCGMPMGWPDVNIITREDGTLEGRRYTSIDANGLALLTFDKIFALEDSGKLEKMSEEERTDVLDKLKKATDWSIGVVDTYNGLIAYEHAEHDETWQDGNHAIINADKKPLKRPVATVLEQAIYWDALNKMADMFADSDKDQSDKAQEAAINLQRTFNEKFVIEDENGKKRIVRAIGGIAKKGEDKTEEEVITCGNIDELNALGFTHQGRTILNEHNEQYIPEIVQTLFDELKTPFGLRNQSINSPEVEGNGYHDQNSIWPYANALAVRAMEKTLVPLLNDKSKFTDADVLHKYALETGEGIIRTMLHLNAPIETAHINGSHLGLYKERRVDNSEFTSCRTQAWTVAWGYWTYNYLKENRIEKIYAPPNMGKHRDEVHVVVH